MEQGFESQHHILSVTQEILMGFDTCLGIHKHEGVKMWVKHMTVSEEIKFSLN